MLDELRQYEDLKALTFGKVLGAGIHRKVGVYELDKTLVLKVATDAPNINLLENEVWQMVEHTDLAKWFAPCVEVSPSGIFLLQKRIEMRPKSEYPNMIPSFFTDTKYSNYGWIDGKFVCCDYANVLSTSMSHKWSARLKKAEWWDHP